jgi:hypothetical protein
MGSRIECFWLDPVAMARSELRRYENADYKAPPSCPANRMSHHDTTAYLEDVPYPLDAENGGYGRDDVPHDDPRWPRVCETCGYAFRDTDYWQHNVTRLYREERQTLGPNGQASEGDRYAEHSNADISRVSDRRVARRVLSVCVFLDGQLVHDPHPSRDGIASVEGWYLLFPLAKCARS